ncbi:MAG: MFS transporter, partial [Nitrososphaeria archaeon]|nr:MFS transporter [Nitrososphaeria archaeon]NIQ32840.1 MFS transporter [Nitrososphaeria archaeon]
MDKTQIRRTLYVVSTLGFLHMFGHFALMPILSLFMVNLGATVLLVGVIYPMLSIVHFSLSFLTGSLSDAFGRIPLIKIGMLIFSLSCLLGYFALDVWWVLIVLIMMGIAMALKGPTIQAAIADLFPPRKMGEAIGKLAVITHIGTFIGPMVTAILIEIVGYRGIFLISFLTGLIGFAMSFLLRKESSMVDSSVKRKKFIAEIKFFPKFFRNRGVFSPSLAAFFYSFSIAVVLLYYPLIASDRGLSISEISITMMLWNSSFILSPFVGRLSDRIG